MSGQQEPQPQPPTNTDAPVDPAAGHAPAEAQLIRMEVILGAILSVGVWGSLIVILAGLILCFAGSSDWRGGAESFAMLTRPEAASIRSVTQVAVGVVRFDGPSIVMLGIVMLISTPAIRVAASLVVYLRQRDRIYVCLTGLVLILLLLGYFKKQAAQPEPTTTQPAQTQPVATQPSQTQPAPTAR